MRLGENLLMQHLSTTSGLRRKRKWVDNLADIGQLGRPAKQIARVSASRLIQRPVAKCLAKYLKLLVIERASKLLRGDLRVELIDEHGLRAIDLARRTGERQSDLSEMYRTAKAFPPHRRL